MTTKLLSLAVASLLGIVGTSALADSDHTVRHVLLISVDGLHQSDLAWFVRNHPDSALARLVREGVEYTEAVTPFPSDSFPGLVGQVTGGHPKTTGIYYDDAYSRALLPPGTTRCSGVTPGAEVHYAKNIDKDPSRLDAGQNIPGLYEGAPESFALISSLSSHPARDLIDPAHLPVDPQTCQPVYPHQYLKVNTVFDVAHARDLRTAWSDKHPAYDILSRSGLAVDDFFTPEIDSAITNTSDTFSALNPGFVADNISSQLYDEFKVNAVLNWIAGHDHTGFENPGIPALFGMSFQAVSAAQKFVASSYYDPVHLLSKGSGGYTLDPHGHPVPGPVLADAMTFVDTAIGRMVKGLNLNNTVVIVSAKHGQSPENRRDLTVINDKAMIDALNASWKRKTGSTGDLVALATNDDSVLLWLSEHSQRAADFAAHFLMHYSGNGLGFDGAGKEVTKPFTHAGLTRIYAGGRAASFIGVPFNDPRVPDVIGIAKQGSIYANEKLYKIAEHGGYTRQDRHVALVIAGAGIHHDIVNEHVETTQIAPTILKLLRLDPNELQAVRREGTHILPNVYSAHLRR